MKTKILSILALAAAVVGLSACSEDWNPKTDKTGQVSLKSMGVEVSGAEKVVSRSEVDLSNYLVKIYNSQNAIVEQWTYSQMPEIFTLPVGDYHVDVVSHEVKKAAWDEPLFAGSQAFVIKNNEITEVGNVKCVFSSLKVTVKYTDDLRAAMGSDVQVKIVANDTGELTYLPDETRAGYFEVVDGSTTLAAIFTGSVNGYNENLHKVYTDVEPGQHRIITFSLRKNPAVPDPETGMIDPSNGINIDVNVEDEDINGIVAPSEDPVTPDNPNTEVFKDKVTFESPMSFDREISTADIPADATVKIIAPNGLTRLSLALTSDNADAVAAASNLGSFGLPTSANGETELTLDFTQLIARLADYPGLHSVSISAADTEGNEMSKALKFRTREPSTIEFETELLKDGTPMLTTEYAETAVVDISVPNGLAKLMVTITPGTEEFGGILDEFGLLKPFDMVNPQGTTKDYLLSLGLIKEGEDLKGATEVNFDIRKLIPLLNMYPAEHAFTVEVTDVTGASDSLELVFISVEE